MNLLSRSTVAAITLLGFSLAAAAQDDAVAGANAAQTRSFLLGKFVEKFKAADADGNGSLNKSEMEKGFPRLAPHFDEIDANHDGGVTMAEIGAYMKTLRSGQ